MEMGASGRYNVAVVRENGDSEFEVEVEVEVEAVVDSSFLLFSALRFFVGEASLFLDLRLRLSVAWGDVSISIASTAMAQLGLRRAVINGGWLIFFMVQRLRELFFLLQFALLREGGGPGR